MVPLISFKSTLFDPHSETPNPINPIAGQSPLLWLAQRLPASMPVTAVEPEDWGWYCYVKCEGTGYLLGSAFVDDDEGGEGEWMLQVHKQRTLLDRLRGRGRMQGNDPLLQQLVQLLQNAPGISGLIVEPGR